MSCIKEFVANEKNVNKKDFVYSNKAQTSIYLQQPLQNNPQLTVNNFLSGYDVMEYIQ